MLSNLWNVVLYKPLLNALAFLISVVPGGDVGVAIIILTIFVKIVLFPLSKRSIENQAKINLLTPEINKIKESKASKEEQAKQTFDLYKKYGTNPFSGCLLVLVQIPIIFALYYVFYKGMSFEAGTLYSFVKTPEHINLMFLGVLDIGSKSLVLAILAGVSQYFQAQLMPKPVQSENTSNKPSFQDSFAKSMQVQMKYVLPFVVAFISYGISGAVALYWVTSNVFAIGQQMYFNKKTKLTKIIEIK